MCFHPSERMACRRDDTRDLGNGDVMRLYTYEDIAHTWPQGNCMDGAKNNSHRFRSQEGDRPGL